MGEWEVQGRKGSMGDGCAPPDRIFPEEKSGQAHRCGDDAQITAAARILEWCQEMLEK